jgi:transcriptional regulator with XRE-family HTH domain
MSTRRELGAQLRARRRLLGESQAEAAAALGVTRQWLGPGRGRHREPGSAAALRLRISADAWRQTASLLRIDADALIDRGQALADTILERLPGVITQVRDLGVVSPVLDELMEAVERHVLLCRSVLAGTMPPSIRAGRRP